MITSEWWWAMSIANMRARTTGVRQLVQSVTLPSGRIWVTGPR